MNKRLPMKMKFLLSIALAFVSLMANATEDKNTVVAPLKTVTVYKSGAELQHQFTANLKQGNNELWVDGISNTIDINSIQLKAPAAVTVMAIEFSNNYMASNEKSARAKMLEDSLQSIDKERDKINIGIKNTNDLMEVLNANRDIKGTQTGLSVAELIKLMDYYKVKQSELQNDISVFNEKRKKLDAQYTKIRNQLIEEESKNIVTSGRLTIQFSAAMAGKYDCSVSYVSPNTYWTPFYDVKMESVTAPLKISYKAKIFQTTGIDWKQVKLSLSNSVPSQWGNAPVLTGWYLGYINPITAMNKTLAIANTLQGRARGLVNRFDTLEFNTSSYKGDASLNDVVVTGYGNSSAFMEYKAEQKPAKPIYIVNGSIMEEQEFQK